VGVEDEAGDEAAGRLLLMSMRRTCTIALRECAK
jgi:hypothetical protein